MRAAYLTLVITGVTLFGATACSSSDLSGTTPTVSKIRMSQPPIAKIKPHDMTMHGHTRTDPYYWMRDDLRKSKPVLEYLDAENDYIKAEMAHTQSMQDGLFQELTERIKPNDSSVPVRYGQYEYWEEYSEGNEYPVYMRRDLDGQNARAILDVNELSKPFDYYDVSGLEVSDSGVWLAYTEDTVSRGEYVLRFKNLETGDTLDTKIPMVSSALAWASDNKTLYYVKLQKDTLIPHQVWRHQIDSDFSNDDKVYEENDSTFYTWITRTRDGHHVLVGSTSTLSGEMQLIDAHNPAAPAVTMLPREENHEYFIEPRGNTVFIHTNSNAKNFRLVKAPLSTVGDRSTWKEVVPGHPELFLSGVEVFNDYIVLQQTIEANNTLTILPEDGSEPFVIDSDEAAYSATIGSNPNMDSSVLRYSYESMATPDSVIDYDTKTGQKTLRKQDFAGSNFSRGDYETARIQTVARDGTKVPVSLLYKKGLKSDGTNPVYVLGYGSYGSTYEPGFNSTRLSLVDRGFVFALAHIRGGQEKGRAWYEDGKLLNKKNTFTDFIDVAEDLVKRGWGHPEKVAGTGRSAGGLLIGAVANMAPETFDVLLTEVPFVDVVTTMLDESIPLTTFEFDEWGNPKDKEYYDYMLSYSPYDQIEAKDYPHILVSTGLWDPAVQYWEPAKWVAKLRATKTDNNKLYFYTDMNAGHRGSAGRFKRQQDYARKYAFLFDVMGVEF
ncbi:MAG: S9 family peptidase [Gammaproteobacteria bacterium]